MIQEIMMMTNTVKYNNKNHIIVQNAPGNVKVLTPNANTA